MNNRKAKERRRNEAKGRTSSTFLEKRLAKLQSSKVSGISDSTHVVRNVRGRPSAYGVDSSGEMESKPTGSVVEEREEDETTDVDTRIKVAKQEEKLNNLKELIDITRRDVEKCLHSSTFWSVIIILVTIVLGLLSFPKIAQYIGWN